MDRTSETVAEDLANPRRYYRLEDEELMDRLCDNLKVLCSFIHEPDHYLLGFLARRNSAFVHYGSCCERLLSDFMDLDCGGMERWNMAAAAVECLAAAVFHNPVYGSEALIHGALAQLLDSYNKDYSEHGVKTVHEWLNLRLKEFREIERGAASLSVGEIVSPESMSDDPVHTMELFDSQAEALLMHALCHEIGVQMGIPEPVIPFPCNSIISKLTQF